MSWRGNFKTWRSWVAAGLAVAGCGKGTSPEGNPQGVTDEVALTSFSGANACADLEQYLEDNAVKMMRTQIEGERDNVPNWGWWAVDEGFGFGAPVAEDAAGASNSAPAAPANYTTTNVQVAGVDEADFVKNDGTRIFVLSGETLYANLSWPASELSLQGKLDVEGWPVEMFLTDDNQIVIFSNVWQQLPLSNTQSCNSSALDCGYYYSNSAKMTVVDVSTLSAPKVTAEYYLPGSYNNSRRIGDSVRVVLSDSLHYPSGVSFWPSGDLGSSCWGWGSTCSAPDKAKRDAAFNSLMDDNEKLIRATTLAQ